MTVGILDMHTATVDLCASQPHHRAQEESWNPLDWREIRWICKRAASWMAGRMRITIFSFRTSGLLPEQSEAVSSRHRTQQRARTSVLHGSSQGRVETGGLGSGTSRSSRLASPLFLRRILLLCHRTRFGLLGARSSGEGVLGGGIW